MTKVLLDIRPDGYGKQIIEEIKVECGEMSDFEYNFFNHLKKLEVMDYFSGMCIESRKVFWQKSYRKEKYIYADNLQVIVDDALTSYLHWANELLRHIKTFHISQIKIESEVAND